MSMQVKRKWLYVATSILFFVGAITIFLNLDKARRFPAAIPGISSFVDMKAKEILSVASILRDQNYYNLHLGLSAETCAKYKNLEIVFTAEGIAVSGSKPQLNVRTSCQDVVKIPYKILLEKSPRADHSEYGIEVKHIIGFWPDRWLLTKIRLKGDSDSLILSYEDIQKHNMNLGMDWNSATW